MSADAAPSSWEDDFEDEDEQPYFFVLSPNPDGTYFCEIDLTLQQIVDQYPEQVPILADRRFPGFTIH